MTFTTRHKNRFIRFNLRIWETADYLGRFYSPIWYSSWWLASAAPRTACWPQPRWSVRIATFSSSEWLEPSWVGGDHLSLALSRFQIQNSLLHHFHCCANHQNVQMQFFGLNVKKKKNKCLALISKFFGRRMIKFSD